jgi:hypothetical protein
MAASPGSRPVDQEALADALRALGMLYGAQREALAEIAAGARNMDEAIRTYILRERPHLLACYDIETLVGLVRDAIERRSEHRPALEPFLPS